jgi:hypothetical protein
MYLDKVVSLNLELYLLAFSSTIIVFILLNFGHQSKLESI